MVGVALWAALELHQSTACLHRLTSCLLTPSPAPQDAFPPGYGGSPFSGLPSSLPQPPTRTEAKTRDLVDYLFEEDEDMDDEVGALGVCAAAVSAMSVRPVGQVVVAFGGACMKSCVSLEIPLSWPTGCLHDADCVLA